MGTITIEAYLRGKVGYEVADDAIATILLDRELWAGIDATELTQQQRDLCTADLYMWCASTPSTRSSTEEADGGWKETKGGWQSSAFDKRQLRAMAKEIYDRYGESAARSVITINSL